MLTGICQIHLSKRSLIYDMTTKYFCEELFPCTDVVFNIAEKCVKEINFWKFMSIQNEKNKTFLNRNDKYLNYSLMQNREKYLSS